MGYSASNERLEFLGDKVIDLITTEFLFDKFPDKNEGFLTKLKSRMVKKESLAKLAENLGFKEIILLSSHVERISGRDNPRLLEDTFESFIGTLYKDQKSNLEICKCFLLAVYERFIDIDDLVNNNDNFKDTLLRYFHSRNWGHPEYFCESEDPACREFKTYVKINEKIKKDLAESMLSLLKTCFFTGKTKKIGQQNVSKIWLSILKVPADF
jgi:ribonuclease-3